MPEPDVNMSAETFNPSAICKNDRKDDEEKINIPLSKAQKKTEVEEFRISRLFPRKIYLREPGELTK